MAKEAALPAVVKVLGKTFSIEWSKSAHDSDEPSSGECSVAKQVIKVDLGFHHEYNQDTLLHELLHAIDDSLNLKAGERRVHALSTALLAVMKDNPRVRQFIFGNQKWQTPPGSSNSEPTSKPPESTPTPTPA
jgi:hypothetical protein